MDKFIKKDGKKSWNIFKKDNNKKDDNKPDGGSKKRLEKPWILVIYWGPKGGELLR